MFSPISTSGISTNRSITGADSLWKLINTPVITIFSDLKNATAKQTLSALLESLLKRSATLTTVLVPPFGIGIENDMIQGQYSAFTTWLFGIMFYIVADPLSDDILSKSIEIQACMLRILSTDHITGFEIVSKEYINIIQEVTSFYVSSKDEDEITLKKFCTGENTVENIDLRAFPVVVKSVRIPTIQFSILKIILDTGVVSWDNKTLTSTMLEVIKKSVPAVKFLALDVCTHLLDYDLIDSRESTYLILYVMEIVKSLPTYQALEEELNQWTEILARFIHTCPIAVCTLELCLTILNTIPLYLTSCNSKSMTLMTEIISHKMKEYFSLYPQSYSASEVETFIPYFRFCKGFIRIFVGFVLNDIQRVHDTSEEIDVEEISEAWVFLRRDLINAVENERYDRVIHAFHASWQLQYSLNDLNIKAKLFGTDLNSILKILLDRINSGPPEKGKLIFECFTNMMRLDEANKSILERILALPFADGNNECPQFISTNVINIAKNLDKNLLLDILEILCEYGKELDRLKLLNMCMSTDQEELAVAAVLNSVLLLKDKRIKLESIAEYVLQAALCSKNEDVQVMLAEALGRMACYLSGCGKITRSSDDMMWTVDCDYCNKDLEPNQSADSHTLSHHHENILGPYLSLISSEFVAVRLRISENILHFSNHAESFNNNETAKTWLSYIEDENPAIRYNVAKAIGQIIRNKINGFKQITSIINNVPDALKEFIDLIMKTILNALITVLETSNHSLHETVLLTAKNCALTKVPLTEKKALSVFLISILHPASSPVSVAYATEAYQDIAHFLNLTPKTLFVRYKKDFLKLIMSRAVYNYIDYSYNIATSLHRVAKCIGYEGSRELLRKNGQYAVCFLLSFIYNKPNTIRLLQDFAELIGADEKQMLIEYFPYICSDAFLNNSLETTLETLKFVAKITQVGLPQLTTRSFMGIFEELMINFYESPERIIGLLEIISKYDTNTRVNFNKQAQIASYLNLRLHGILVNFDIKLGPKSDEYTQQAILASLAALIRYMGATYITPLRYKILATLRTSLGFTRPGFGPLICDAWNAFIHNITIEDLGPLLPTICVSLIPLIKTYPEEVNAMLQYLIVECAEENFTYIAELFFIDDIEVPERISSIVKARILQARPHGFEANLKLWLKRIVHETDEVRARALSYLKRFLAENRSQLNAMILSETGIHPLIVDLLDALLMGCRDKEESVRVLYGECLGELGAIEPSLLPRRIRTKEDSAFIPDMNKSFACAMLIELVRAFQMQKSSQSMDCFSLAIQEIIKAYGISPTGVNSALWNNLPLNVQQIITPFVTSHYKIVATSNENDLPHPIYGSDSSLSVENWAYNWLCSMFNYIPDKTVSTVLHACKLALKRDIKILTFCLPYVVAFIVTRGIEQQQTKIREEMLAVIHETQRQNSNPKILENSIHNTNVNADETGISEETKRTRCAQIVFSILDHLQRWLWEQRLNRDSKYEGVKTFLGKLDNLIVAECCYRSQEYHRALMYLEQHMESSNNGLSDSRETGLLVKIYAQLDEPDGVGGVLETQDDTPTLQQLVLAHKISGRLQDAVTCYERLAQKKELQYKYLQDMIECYVSLDHPVTAKHIIDGILSKSPELEPLIMDEELFWRLPHFTRLEDTAQRNIKHSLLDDLKKGVAPDLSSLKKNLVSSLEDSARPGAYQQNYSYIMKLHILNEFDKAVSAILSNVNDFSAILEEWEKRGQLIRAARGVEFVLSMRRATLDLAVLLQKETTDSEDSMLKQEIGKIWLKSAKIARKSGLHQQAYMYILSATDWCPPQQLYIEQAQLYWQKGCQEDAFTTLKRCFAKCFKPATYYKQLPTEDCVEERRQCAKAKLLFAKYNDETLNVDTDVNVTNYKEAIEVWRGWEKSLLSCAQYYESIVDRMTDEEKDLKGRDLQVHMMHYYGKSLQYGCKYINQSMPRMLTIWLDYASRNALRPAYCAPQDAEKLQQSLLKMTQIIDIYQDRLPPFMWLTAFSQLVSRICHPSSEVQNSLCNILVKVIHAYPQQCLWMMASVFNSSYPVRQRRCQEILNNVKLKTPELTKLIKDFNKLWERLIELSNKAIPNGTSTTTINQLSKNLPRLLTHSDFSPIMMPTTKFRQMHLPAKGVAIDNYNPFSANWVQIAGVGDTVAIMPSLQRPRRITLKGSDGKEYLFMCKPKDDLRKDFRLMEFNDIVNKYLQTVPESRQRRLYIRTYSVVPLNEECGLIEWVPNLVGLRPVILSLHKERGVALSHRELKTMLCDLKDPLEKKRKMFLEKLLPRNPSVLGDWFRLTFPDPYGWYEARTAYIRTTAVMSMVGYILGLGDRHGENILIDSKCGDCVHVDFNCLFNRGELLDWPERVPFRLTHNMIDAMGPLKTEGQFRRACEVTMRVLRQQSSTLLSVLTPFVYDPLVSWNKNQPSESSEKTNEKAVENIKNIEQRLKGLIRSHGKKLENIALNLSVEGQTKQLILEATNIDNLCQMYFGWGAYL